MPEQTDPQMIIDMVSNLSRIYDRSPHEVRAIHDIVVEHLDRGPHGTFPDGYAHVADHLREIFPVVMEDERLAPARTRVLDEYARMPATPATRLRQAPGENSLGAAAGIGAGVIIVVALVTVAYCLGGEDPAPGESVAARC